MTAEQIRAALDDRTALVCTLVGEVAGEPIHGVLGVACAIRNRVLADLHQDGKPDWWGEGFKAVCLAKWQFSCWWEVSQNTTRVYRIAETLLSGQRPSDAVESAMVDGLRLVADAVLEDRATDVTRGSTHYLTTALLQTKPPAWTVGRHPAIALGHHSFFSGVE